MKKTNLPLQSTDEKLKAYFPNVYTVRIALIFYQESLFENQTDLYRFEWMNLSDSAVKRYRVNLLPLFRYILFSVTDVARSDVCM